MTAPRTIMRVRRTDVAAQDDHDYVLVSVQATGPQPLDLKLIGTEGANVYPTSIRHKKAKDHQLRPAYKGSDADWEAILMGLLVRKPVDATGHGATALDDIEIVSAVSDDRLNLTLRKNIAGVTQRIGAIHLNQDNDEEISLFDWTKDAIASRDRLESDYRNLLAKYNELQRQYRQLSEQLEAFVHAKQNHETALVAKLEQIINAKKLKIRNLQRLLACAKVDPVADEAAAVEGARKSTRGRRAGLSRPNKRAASNGAESESEEDSTFEPRKPKPADDEDDDETDDADVTPDNSAHDETEEEQDGDMGEDASVPGAAKPGEGTKKKAIETVAGNGNSPEQREPDSPPPRRELPFARKAGQGSGQQQQSEPSAADEDEDDTTDDEL